MVFGTFDGLHKGHLSFFRQAKKYGNNLIAVIARSSTVKAQKGRLPLFSEKMRLEALKHVKIISRARLGHRIDHCRVIWQEKPDIICLGYDQKISPRLEKQIRKLGVNIVRLKSYKPEIYKSSLFRKSQK